MFWLPSYFYVVVSNKIDYSKFINFMIVSFVTLIDLH